jgi:hypothetical protein
MKKLLAITAMSAIASLGIQSAQAGSWNVVCIKQGPARCFQALPQRVLDPNAVVSPGNSAGYPIGARSIATQAEAAEASDVVGDMNFVSLGFGGQIVLEYTGGNFGNGPGVDVTVFETTWGDPNCTPNVSETAEVEFSLDGFNWTPKQSACHNGSFDIAPLLMGKYVRITDVTNSACNVKGDGVDAYDVDGVVANYDFGSTPPLNPLCDYQQGTSKQFIGGLPGQGIVGQRKFFANANINDPTFTAAELGNPALRESVGNYNFWSLGFGGYACFQLPYTVFDGAGVDFRIFETTWNNKPCPNYPETVSISVSVDGVTYSAPQSLCKDGDLDLSAYGAGYDAVNYIKFVDASNPASFGKGDDAFDIDNIYIAQLPPGGGNPPLCSPVTGGNRRALPSVENNVGNTGVPEAMFPLEIVGSNVVSDKIAFAATIAEEGGYNYSVRNHIGQELASGQLEGNLYDFSEKAVSTDGFANGVYFLTLTSANSKETVKFIKK